MDALSIDREALDAIMAHSREAHPEECCGAIIARGDRDVVHGLLYTSPSPRDDW